MTQLPTAVSSSLNLNKDEENKEEEEKRVERSKEEEIISKIKYVPKKKYKEINNGKPDSIYTRQYCLQHQ